MLMILDQAPSLFQQHMYHVYNICLLITCLTFALMFSRVKVAKITRTKAILFIGIAETTFFGVLVTNLIIQSSQLSETMLYGWIAHFYLYLTAFLLFGFQLSPKERALTAVVLCIAFFTPFFGLFNILKVQMSVASLISGLISILVARIFDSWLLQRRRKKQPSIFNPQVLTKNNY